MPTDPRTIRHHAPARMRVDVCFDPDDDVAITHAVHARCTRGSGCIALAPGPDTGTAEQLQLHLLLTLGVLWRMPRRLQSGRTYLSEKDLAVVGWEISWALHRAGITELWVLRAEQVGITGWAWLRDIAEREQLRLVLMNRGHPPEAYHLAALRGCQLHRLNPDQLRPAGHPEPPAPWWQHPTIRQRRTSGPQPALTDERDIRAPSQTVVDVRPRHGWFA